MNITKLGIDPSKYEVTDIDYDAKVDEAISNFNRLGISLMDYSASTRHRAFILESEITKAANEERREDFDMLLSEWRKCFH